MWHFIISSVFWLVELSEMDGKIGTHTNCVAVAVVVAVVAVAETLSYKVTVTVILSYWEISTTHNTFVTWNFRYTIDMFSLVS